MSAAVVRLVNFYESLTEQSLAELSELYAADAYFKDPFNEVRGIEAIRGIFSHMFTALNLPRFVVQSSVVQGNEAFLVWEFRFAIKRYQPSLERVIRGTSHLKFDDAGRVSFHRDYWDAAEELYEKLPLIGALMRWLKRRMS